MQLSAGIAGTLKSEIIFCPRTLINFSLQEENPPQIIDKATTKTKLKISNRIFLIIITIMQRPKRLT
jgi:hypothetical protein